MGQGVGNQLTNRVMSPWGLAAPGLGAHGRQLTCKGRWGLQGAASISGGQMQRYSSVMLHGDWRL